MIIPFRTENPPEHFPFVTLTLIILNVLIYLLTSLGQLLFLRVDEGPAGAFWPLRTTPEFVESHDGDVPPREYRAYRGEYAVFVDLRRGGRGTLRPLKFLILYFVAGWTGGLLSDLLLGAVSPDAPSLGASGAIMGVAGAYLYMFPFSRVRLFYILPLGFFWRFGLAEWQALWVVMVYVGMDVLFGIICTAQTA